MIINIRTPDKLSRSIALILLAGMIIAAYWPVLSNGFLDYDDASYVINNDHVSGGLTLESIRWALSTTYFCNWHPLTWISHMLDISVFGHNPAGHHAVNMAIHIVNTILLYGLLKRLTEAFWPSLAVASLFALHPLHVESVAWIAERKDLLSTFFFFLTIEAYLWWRKKPDISRYVLMMLLFACGLASKPMLVTLPFVLLLLDIWPLRRPGADSLTVNYWKTTVIEKLPLILLSAMSAVLTVIAQRSGGSLNQIGKSSLAENTLNAFSSYLRYIYKMFLPLDLAILYPFPSSPEYMFASVSALILLTVSIIAVRCRNSRPWFFFGWFWYLGTLVPVIGIVHVGVQALADRYTYIPLIGLFVALVWSIDDYAAESKVVRSWSAASGVAVMLVLAVLTWKQTAHWKNSYTLFQHTLSVTENNHLAMNNYASELIKQGRVREALKYLEEAIRIKPDYGNAFYNMGIAYNNLRQPREAAWAFGKAVTNAPIDGAFGQIDIQALFQYGKESAKTGDMAEAERAYRELLKIDGKWAEQLMIYVEYAQRTGR